MSKTEEILRSKRKPKEKVAALTDALKNKEVPAKEFMRFFEAATDVDKGTCADVMKHVANEAPEILGPFVSDLIEFIDYPASRVRWGIPEAIGNLSRNYPEKVKGAIPKLLINSKDESTVARWCAAYGLTEIAKNNPKTRKELIPFFKTSVEKEENNGVRNAYVKALEFMEKEKR